MLKALLIDRSVGSTGRYARLEGGPLVLGRAPYADMAFDSRFISRRHARISHEADVYYIEDLDSANGTAINEGSVGSRKVALQPGDTISLADGAVLLHFEIEEATVRLSSTAAAVSSPFRSIEVDSARRVVSVNGKEVNPPLSRKEFDALEALYLAGENARSMDEIAEAAWPERDEGQVSPREIAQLMRRIRRRLQEIDNAAVIQNVRGFGYRLTDS